MDWFKIWPSQYLNIINRISDGAQRGAFSLLLLHCLNDGSLPDDDEEIAYITGLPVELVTGLRPHLKRLAKIEDGRIVIHAAAETIKERQEFGAKKAQAGKTGGEARREKAPDAKQPEAEQEVSAEAKQAENSEAVLSSAKQCLADESTAKQDEAQLSHTDRQTDNQTDKQTDRQESPPAPTATARFRPHLPTPWWTQRRPRWPCGRCGGAWSG